ncbi:MAG: histidine phosphatase family protein [Candidatus Brocadiia bacterium]
MNEGRATRVTVVRHGETVWNVQGKQQGHLDSDLTALGVRQAGAAADALAGEGFDAFYSSDLERAMQTARIIAERLDMEVRPEAGLRERHLGILQGLTMAQFEEEQPEHYARFRSREPDYVIPEGESIRQRYERSVQAAEAIARRHPGRRVLVVTHGGVLASFFRHALGLSLTEPRRFSLYNAAINRFSVADGQWRLESWGLTEHLRGLGTIDDW